MFRHTISSLFFLCFWFTVGYGQELKITYHSVQDTADRWRTEVYMQSEAEDSVIIRAVNFSFLSDSSCAVYTKEKKSVFADHWSQFLERQFEMKDVEIKKGELNFTHRLLYGIAEPQGMPGTGTLKIPGSKAESMLVLQVTYKGACAQQIIMEHEKENAMNQIGDQSLFPMKYQLIPAGGE